MLLIQTPARPDYRTRGLEGSREWSVTSIEITLQNANPLDAADWAATIEGASWASLDVASGTIPASGSVVVTLTFDPAALSKIKAPFGAQGRLLIDYTSPLETGQLRTFLLAAAIPPKLSVAGRPTRIEVPGDGTYAPTGWTETVTNLTNDALDVTPAAMADWLTIDPDEPFVLAGGASQDVEVTVDPDVMSDVGGEFAIRYTYEDP